MSAEPRERRLNILIAIVTLALIPLGVLSAVAAWNGIWDRDLPDCSDWSFDQGAWEADSTRDDQALALVRCDTLVGMTRTEVVDVLGTRDRSEDGHRWRYGAGVVHSALGPGDAQSLFVGFSRHDRVQRADLRYGGRGGMAAD